MAERFKATYKTETQQQWKYEEKSQNHRILMYLSRWQAVIGEAGWRWECVEDLGAPVTGSGGSFGVEILKT